MINKEKKKKYLENPDNCPFCGSSYISGDNFDGAYNQAWRDITCNSCKTIWREIFTITDIEMTE